MGSGASTAIREAIAGRRYLRGKRPEAYFEQVVLGEVQETLDLLRLDMTEPPAALELFLLFVEVDDDNSGSIGVDEFHKFLGIDKTRYSERVFSVLDLDMGGTLDFREFLVGVWNCCTYGLRDIAKFVFDIFDVDQTRRLMLPEYHAMLRMLSGAEEADPGLMKILRDASTLMKDDDPGYPQEAGEGGGVGGIDDEEEDDPRRSDEIRFIQFSDFEKLCAKWPQILQPAFDLQRSMRRRMLGVAFWEKCAETRKDLCAGEESTSWEAVAAVLRRKQEERAAVEAARIRAIEEEAERELRERCAEENEVLAFAQTRLVLQKEKLAADKLPEERVEKECWVEFAALKKQWSEFEGCSSTAAPAKNALRVKYCFTVKLSISAARAAMEARAAVRRRVAEEENAPLKAEAWVKSKVGAAKFEALASKTYERLYRESGRGGALSRAAPAFSARLFPSGKLMEEAKKSATSEIVGQFREQELQELETRLEEEAEEKERDFEAFRVEAQAVVGSRTTRWERVAKPGGLGECLCHCETKVMVPLSAKICDTCDNLDESCECMFTENGKRARATTVAPTGTASALALTLGDE